MEPFSTLSPRVYSSANPSGTGNRVTFQKTAHWRQSLLATASLAAVCSLVVSVIVTGVFSWRAGVVQEELLDYIDKSIAISKINFNPTLVSYKLNESELHVLDLQKTYKTLTSCFFFSELVCLLLFVCALISFFCLGVFRRATSTIFCVLALTAMLLSVVTLHLFLFSLPPLSSAVSVGISSILDHAIPYNPGGLQKMEHRLSCSFHYDLYAISNRHSDHQNSCDPRLESSFLSLWLLILLLILRLVPVVFLVLLAANKTPVSEGVAMAMEKIHCIDAIPSTRMYTKKQEARHSLAQNEGERVEKEKKSHIKDLSKKESFLPPTPLPGLIDHNISYNNSAFLATSAPGLNSSRSTDISNTDTCHQFNPAQDLGTKDASDASDASKCILVNNNFPRKD